MPHEIQNQQICKLIILGSGPAGLTAAIYSARAGLAPLLIHGPLPGGQLTTTTEVENYPGFPAGINGPDLMKLMEEQALRFGTQIVNETVSNVNLSCRPFQIETHKSAYKSSALIIATGATAKALGVPKEKELTGYGVSTCATCDGAFFKNRVVMVVGGGDSACEEALFLTRFASKVYLVHRREQLRASKIMQERLLKNQKIQPIWNCVVKEIIGDRQVGVQAVVLTDLRDGGEKRIDCEGLFVAIGHVPNSELFRPFLTLDHAGYIVPKPNSTATSVPGVFACGDVQDHIFRQAITAAGSGCMAAIEAERWLEAQEQ